MEVEQEEDIEEIEDIEDIDDINDFCVDDTINREESPDYAQEITTLVSAIGVIDAEKQRIENKPFIRGEYCYAAIARLEYLLRSEYTKNVRTKDDQIDDDCDNNEIFNKCGEFMVVTKKLVPCFRATMQDIIKYGLNNEKSKPLLRIIQCLIKMFTRFTFPLTHDLNNNEDNYINYNKYNIFVEYQQTFKKSLIDNDVLHQIMIMMGSNHCGLDLDPDERSEVQIDTLELYLCLLKNILSIPNPPNPMERDNFLHDRAILSFKEEKVMDIMIELTSNIYEETEKIQYLLMEIFYQYFRMEDVESLLLNNNKRNGGRGRGGGAHNNNNNGDILKQYQRERLQRKNKLKRTRHNKWGGMSRIKMMNGQTRIQSLGTNTMSNANMHDRRKAARFRPIKEKKKRVYLSDNVKNAVIYVGDRLLEKSFASLMSVMQEKFAGKPEFELNASSACKKWFKLISFFLQFHRSRTRLLSIDRAKADGVIFSSLKWYSSSSISCIMKAELINFVITRVETLFENRKFKHLGMDFSRLEQALLVYKEIIRSIYSMVQYGNDANKLNGLKLFEYIFEDHRGPQLINDMIREYKAHQSTKLCLSHCIEAVYYTINMIERMQKEGNALKVKTKKKKRKKKRNNNDAVNDNNNNNNDENEMEEDVERAPEEEDEEKNIVEVAGMEIHDEDMDDMDDDDDEFMFVQKNFDFQKFLKSYAANKVIAQYMYVLQDYFHNGAKLNSYIITLLDKLAFQLDDAPRLFQLSYFVLFEEILNDKGIEDDKQYKSVIKFCKKILCEFFIRSKKNAVLFCEILFYKTPQAIDDINNPGSVHQQRIERAERESRRNERRNRIEGLDGMDDDDFDDEEEYQQLDMNQLAPWTDDEDTLLRNYYGTYSQQANVTDILQSFLQNELESTRSIAQINYRLRHLGLRTRPIRRNKVNKESKKRIKPKEMSVDQRKTIIYHCIHKACYMSQLQRVVNDDENEENEENEEEKKDNEMKDELNKMAFKWLSDKLDGLCDIIGEVIDASSSILLDDIAIIPIESNEFEFIDNKYLRDLLIKLGFLAPNKYIGTCWWRIPREFKTTDIRSMIDLMKEAMELSVDADLRALCVSNIQSMDIALLNDDSNDNQHNNNHNNPNNINRRDPFELAPMHSDNDNDNNGSNEDISDSDDEPVVPQRNVESENKEESGSEEEEEYEVPAISEMKNNNNNNEQNEEEEEEENVNPNENDMEEVDAERERERKKKKKKDKKKKKKDKKKKEKKKKKKKDKKKKKKKKNKDKEEEEEDGDDENDGNKKKSKKDKKKKKKRKKHKKHKKDKKEEGMDENEESKKKSKKKRKSRKRKREETDDNDDGDDDDGIGDFQRKRRRLNVNGGDKDEEDMFFDDVVSDMDEESDNNDDNDDIDIDIDVEMENNKQSMNTPQIKKFKSLSLNENKNILNVIKENVSDHGNDDEDESDDDIIPKRKVTKRSKRAFVSDSDSD